MSKEKEKEKTKAEQFIAIYKAMKPRLRGCCGINLAAVREADETTQIMCLRWLQAIKEGPYARLCNLLRDLPEDQWAFRMAHFPDMDEVKQRKQLERKLRLVWQSTLPPCLQKIHKPKQLELIEKQ